MAKKKHPATILIVDDDIIFCSMLEDLLQQMGHQPEICHRIDECKIKLNQQTWDLILLDVGLPDGSGLSLLPVIRQTPKAPEVIIITGDGDASGAELAITNGAWDYLVKTTALERINLTVARALEHHRTSMQLQALKTLDVCGIIGKSPALLRCLSQVGQAASNNFNVLITGQSGTGKELFARAIHANSDRVMGQLVVVDCAALPTTLVESVLFGHVKGAFTGADHDAKGLFKSADGGTLFMDEVGELPLDLQRIFLRVLQEKSFRPVGSSREIPSNFRLIAATNKNLDDRVDKGHFREDLLFRLQSMSLNLPPLKDRGDDLDLLVTHFLDAMTRGNQTSSSQFLRGLAAYDWPGNIRELIHVLESAVAAASGESHLIPQHLPPKLRVLLAQKGMEQAKLQPALKTNNDPPLPPIRQYRLEQDKKYLIRLIGEARKDMQRAAMTAGLSLSRLYSLLREHGLKS